MLTPNQNIQKESAREEYTHPMVEIVTFSSEDVITTSGLNINEASDYGDEYEWDDGVWEP